MRPLIVISCTHYSKDGWSTCLIDKDGLEKFDMEKIPTKMLWLWNSKRDSNKNCTSPEQSDAPASPFPIKRLIPKFYRVEAPGFRWNTTTFTFEEIVFLGSPNAENIILHQSIVEYENGAPVRFETLLAQFPLLQSLWYTCRPDGSDISTNTVKELLANPNLSNMEFFHLLEIPDTFDVESFYAYLKSQDDLYCLLHFHDDISDAYRERLKAIIDELLSTESTTFQFPSIHVPNLHPDTKNALEKRVEEDCKRRNIEYSIVTL